MKLSLDEYKWLLIDDIFASMTEEESTKYSALYKKNPKEAGKYLDTLQDYYAKKYSYLELINDKYKVIYVDLEGSYAEYEAILKYNDKYYSFEWCDSPYWDLKDEVNVDSDLIEVHPCPETVIKYKKV